MIKRALAAAAVTLAAAAIMAALGGAAGRSSTTKAFPAPQPTLSDFRFISGSTTPPTEAQCFASARKRRCFSPQAIQASYNVAPLYAQGKTGAGTTIAIVDSWGSDTMRHDLHVFDQAFGLAPMCGEEGVTCKTGMPKFDIFYPQGSPATKEQPGNGTHLEDKTIWALEAALDVETAHAIAPGANILLVAPTGAETLGVQGFPEMMNAEQYVIDHHLANVISQSFASAEDAFASFRSLEVLRHAFKSAQLNGVTVLGSSGDGGTANDKLQPVGQGGTTFPFPTVEWPASDPLVTGVGGTYLCTDPTNTATRVVDNADPPAECQSAAFAGQAEDGWNGSGGGFSHVFSKPSYQSSLPAGSTAIGSNRGVPDVAFQASPRTGALVYVSLPPDGNSSNVTCSGSPCSTGWYDIGGTSLSAPQWAGLVAIADQINGGGLGLINPALYKIGADPARYANDFFDVTVGNNFGTDTLPTGYPSTAGWDPVTGLGTPNAAVLLPDLVQAANGH
jgi:subtilase family serine protease